MNKEKILNIVEEHCASSEFSINQNDSNVEIQKEISGLTFKVIVPYDVTELFFEAFDKSKDINIEDWADFYGDREHEDFEDSLVEILDAMNLGNIRLSENKKFIEVSNSDRWQHFFDEEQ